MVRRIFNILIPILLTLVAAWGALEFGLRTFYQLIPLEVCAADPIVGNYICQPYFKYDKPIKIGYRYQPNLHLEGYWDPANPYLSDVGPETRPTGRTEPFWFVLNTDEMGFPNDQPVWDSRYDIIVTGDSFTVRTAPTTWIDALAEESGQSILTLGAPSWTTLNEIEAVKQFGLDKNPRWVILLYFEGNDLLNVQQYLDKQASGLNWKEYDLQGVPFYRRWVTYQIARYYLLEKAAAAPDSSLPPRYRYPVTVASETGPFETVLKDIHLLPISAGYDTIGRSDEFNAIQNGLLDLKNLVEAQEARLLVVYIPSKEHVYWSRIWDEVDVNNILERTVTVTLSEGDHGRLNWNNEILDYNSFNQNHLAQEQLFTDFFEKNRFDYINLTPILWRETIERGEVYHYADPHWNQAGNLLVAKTIAGYLQEVEDR